MYNTTVTPDDIAKMMDLSLLRPEMTTEEVKEGLRIAIEYKTVSVCVKPCDVELAEEMLKGSGVYVTTVIGFPHGSNLPEIKLAEAKLALDQGCVELDFVLNIGRLKSGDLEYVEKDLAAVVDEAHSRGAIVKVIFENFYLTDEEKIQACHICERVGADMVKTSTGYAGGGATIHDLRLMRANVPASMRVKAAGGVRTLDGALNIRAIGVSRFGCTRTPSIMADAYAREAAGTLVLPDPDKVVDFEPVK